jgi:DNA replication and repair protein RecF
MRLVRLILRDFRNLPLVELHCVGAQQFLVGANGQGKTNLVEAVGFFSALRSFRTADARLLIAHGAAEASLAADFVHEKLGETRVVVHLRPGGKEVACDGTRVTRLGDYLGRFPTVVFSSQDQQLVRGGPALRRRWLDLTLAAVTPGYLEALQAFHTALAGRNALLKRGAPEAEVVAFEPPLAAAAVALTAARAEGLAALAPLLAAAYAELADGAEGAALAYAADGPPADAAGWRERYARQRARDIQWRGTVAGPQRDDVALRLAGREARDFGSEGQQRSLVIALRLAQLAWTRERTGVEPLLLADDVLGELDPTRRQRFWRALGARHQVLATGTTLPEAGLGDWQIFTVAAGRVATRPSAV